MEFFKRNKLFIGIVVVTLVLITGGVVLFSGRGATPQVSQNSVSGSLLIPQGDYETSGITNGNYLQASTSAKVTVVEFGDYECPACGAYHPFVKQLLTDFAGKLNYVFRNYPLSQHLNAPIASQAVEAAGLQGKFWQMHDKIFETQNDWANLSDPSPLFIGYAKDLGLNVNQFTSDLNSQKVKDKISSDTNDGNTVGITETPTLYLNAEKITLNGSYNQLKNLVQASLSSK